MPELPEVETTRRGIAPYIVGETVRDVVIRERGLRWPISPRLRRSLKNQILRKLERRAKYLLFHGERGCLILHLGMSGSLRIVPGGGQAPQKHDHVDILLASGHVLRYRDPRKFGALLWTGADPFKHRLIRGLGPEPLGAGFTPEYLYARTRRRAQAIKTLIMDGRIVVGVGNIYANEALFLAGIHPRRKAGRIAGARVSRLVEAIRTVLSLAIKKGGTTLRDFSNGAGKPGYFRHELQVYARAELPCKRCKTPIKLARISQRATYYCPRCQR